jgi:hypothetical protein
MHSTTHPDHSGSLNRPRRGRSVVAVIPILDVWIQETTQAWSADRSPSTTSIIPSNNLCVVVNGADNRATNYALMQVFTAED